MAIATNLLHEYDHEMDNTRKILAAIPDGKWDWKPHEKSMSLGVLAGHVADLPGWGTSTFENDVLDMKGGDYKAFSPSSVPELLERFEQERLKMRSALENCPDEAFARLWTMRWNGQEVLSMPRAAVVRSMIMNHMIHHRGQLSVYIREVGGKVPGIYGPSADEMPPASGVQAP